MKEPRRAERPSNTRRSLLWAAGGLLLFFAGMLLGGFASPGLMSVLPVTAGFLALVLCVRQALLLWDLDRVVFEDSPKIPIEFVRSRPPARPSRFEGGRSGVLRLFGSRLPAGKS